MNASIITLSVIPEWFYQESKLFKGKNFGFPSPRHPGDFRAVFSLPLNASIRGPWFLKVFRFPIKNFGNNSARHAYGSLRKDKKKKKKHGFPIKDFRHDGGGWIPG